MLRKLLPNDLENVRNNFAAHPLLEAIRDACCDCCTIPQYVQFRPEYVFIEVIMLLDILKERQNDIAWERLYTQVTQDYRYLDSNTPKDELDCIAAIVCTTIASVLVMSCTGDYHTIGESLLQQAFAHDHNIPREDLYDLCDRMERYEEPLREWIEAYMNSDEFISEAFESLFADISSKTGKGSPKHIKFVPSASPELKKEFTETLQQAIDAKSNYGKAKDIKKYLFYYKNEYVIELIGSEKDIHADLRTYWGYKQAYNTFSSAEPKLGSNQIRKIQV